jgi:hypothetical protein
MNSPIMMRAYKAVALLTLIVFSATLWLGCKLVSYSLKSYFVARGTPIPALTEIFILNPNWILAVPIPMIVAYLAGIKKGGGLEGALLFGAICFLLCAALLPFSVIPAILPWLPWKFGI